MNYTIDTEIIGVLIDLHDFINRKYRMVLLHPKKIPGDIRSAFERIVELTDRSRKNLVGHAGEQEERPAPAKAADILADITTNADRKSLLGYCANNIKDMLVLYKEVLSESGLHPGLKQLVSKQQTEIIILYTHLRQLHDAQ